MRNHKHHNKHIHTTQLPILEHLWLPQECKESRDLSGSTTFTLPWSKKPYNNAKRRLTLQELKIQLQIGDHNTNH